MKEFTDAVKSVKENCGDCRIVGRTPTCHLQVSGLPKPTNFVDSNATYFERRFLLSIS